MMLSLLETASASKLAYDRNLKMPYRIVHRSNHKVVSFKGDLKIVLDHDSEAFHFCDRRVRIHRGLLQSFHAIEPDLSRELGYRRTDLIFAGHGIGGGLAVLAAVYYAEMYAGRRNVKCHTFGAPRVGDLAFVEWCNERLGDDMIHIVCGNDPMCRLPEGYHDFARIMFPGEHHDIDAYMSCIRRKTSEGFRPGFH